MAAYVGNLIVEIRYMCIEENFSSGYWVIKLSYTPNTNSNDASINKVYYIYCIIIQNVDIPTLYLNLL